MSKNAAARKKTAVVFSRQLRKAMFEKDWTRKGLAEVSGVSRSAIDNYLIGRVEPGAWTIAQLATALGCTAGFLLGLEDE